MDENALNMSIRKYLKEVGVTSQREIENAVREAVSGGGLAGVDSLEVRTTLIIDGIDLSHEVKGLIRIS